MIVRLLVHYEGRVQGVGFRMKAHRLASGFRVSGYVKNLADGRVELLVEGEDAEVSVYLEGVRDFFGDMIRSVQEHPVESRSEPLVGFEIRHSF